MWRTNEVTEEQIKKMGLTWGEVEMAALANLVGGRE